MKKVAIVGSGGFDREVLDIHQMVERNMFTIVIPTKDRPDLAVNVLRCLSKQDFPRDSFEVIVVDDASTRENLSKLQEYINNLDMEIRLFINIENVGPARSRNRGISHAKGEWIAFTDDDVEIPRNWLEIAQNRINKNPDIVGIEGKITTDTTDPLYHFAQNVKGKMSKRFEGYLTANMFYKKSILIRAGKFDEEFPRAFREDSELAFRVLTFGRIPFCNDLVIHHPARKIGLLAAIKREMRHESDPLLNERHPDKYPCLFAPANLLWFILLVVQVTGVILGIASPWTMFGINIWWLASAVTVLLFFLAGGGFSRGIYRWIGSYVRFLAFFWGSIQHETILPIISLTLKSLKNKPILTDAI